MFTLNFLCTFIKGFLPFHFCTSHSLCSTYLSIISRTGWVVVNSFHVCFGRPLVFLHKLNTCWICYSGLKISYEMYSVSLLACRLSGFFLSNPLICLWEFKPFAFMVITEGTWFGPIIVTYFLVFDLDFCGFTRMLPASVFSGYGGYYFSL